MTAPPEPARAPEWREEDSRLPPGGPRRWWRGPQGVILGGAPARVAEELEGWARLGPHPARPALLDHGEDWVMLGPVSEETATPDVDAWPRGAPTRVEGPIGELLSALPGEARVSRALARLGFKRKAVDRLLASPIRAQTRLGPTLGGLHEGWYRAAGDRQVALRWRDAQAEGWSALDLAALGLAGGMDLRDAHHQGLIEAEAEAAFALAELRVGLNEASFGGDPAWDDAAREAAEHLISLTSPQRVQVQLDGAPSWLNPRLWLPEGGEVSAAEARRLMGLLDGLHVGGARLSLRCTPPLRRGRRPPPREDRLTRRRRLFSRWSEGVQVDDEGLLSATPEALALELSQGFEGRVLDATCGVGAWAIALARQPKVRAVVATDVHAGRLEMARHNARIYGVLHKLELRCAPAEEALKEGGFDGLVVDPPWGGRGYDRGAVGLADLGMPLEPLLARAPARVCLKLPRSFLTGELPPDWRWRPAVDRRGVLKFLAASRAP